MAAPVVALPPLPPGFALDTPTPPADFGGALLSRAEKEYPYLSRSGLVAVTGKNGGKRKLEYWPAGEPGSASTPRPSGIPLGSAGVEVFDGSVSPKDLLADYVSHEAVNSDPELKRMYSDFAASVPDELMRERYEYHRKNFGEQRGYETWKERSGMPEYFRGYTFDQWPNAKRMYSPEQLQKLDAVRGYLGIGAAADQGTAAQIPPLPAGFTLDVPGAQPVTTNDRALVGDQLKRQLGLTARLPIDALSALPLLAANAGVATRNALTGEDYELPSQMYEQAMARVFPTPETGIEKGVNIAGSAVAGARLPVPQVNGAPSLQLPLMRGAAPAAANSSSAADAVASARIAPGNAAAESALRATPEVRATGGGYTFGTVGADEAAGLTPTMQRIADRGRDLGMRLTPGQATGSRALQQFEAKLESQPMTSGPFNALKANNASVLNRSAAEAIGESSDVVDAGVLARAADRIGNVFEQVADDVSRTIEPRQFLQFYAGLKDDMRGLVQGLDSHPLVEDVVRFAQEGTADGRQLSSLSSKLGKAAYKSMSTPSGDRDLGIALYRVKDYVDDLLGQGLSPETAAALSTARQQYRNLMLLTQRVGVVNPAKGDVSGRSLANLLQSKDKRGYMYGRNESPMYDAARFSQAFAPIVGDSGTATRMPLQSVTDMVARIPMSLASRAYTSGPAVDLAVRAQAGARAASRSGQGLGRALARTAADHRAASGSVTGTGTGSAARTETREAARRRALAAALARQGIIMEDGR